MHKDTSGGGETRGVHEMGSQLRVAPVRSHLEARKSRMSLGLMWIRRQNTIRSP